MVKYMFIYLIGMIITLASTCGGYYLFTKSNAIVRFSQQRGSVYIVIFASLVYMILFSSMKDLTVLSHHSFYDFAVHLEYFKNFAEGKGLFSTMEENIRPGSGRWLSVHFTPMAYLVGFLFKIFPSFHMVNWFQTIFLALSSVILFWSTKSKLGGFVSMCIALSLLLNPTLQYITLYEFEYFRFIIPLGILTVGFILGRNSTLWCFLLCLSTSLIREDATFFVFGMGIYIFFICKRKLLGMSTMVFSMVYFLVIVLFVMPSLNSFRVNANLETSFFHEFGDSVTEVAQNIILHPVKLFIHLFHPYKSINYIMYLLPFSFVPIFGIEVFVMAFPVISFLAFSGSISHTSYFFYYVSPILVTVVWAMYLGIPRIANFLTKHARLKNTLQLKQPITKESVSFSVLCGSLACCIYFGPSPISIQFWNKDFSLAPFRTNTFNRIRYHTTEHDDLVRKVAGIIPVDASVSTEQFLLSDVYRCKSIYVFPVIEEADYIFIDKENPLKTGLNIPGSWSGLREYPQFYYDWVELRPDVFELVHAEGGVFLYKRKLDAFPYPQPFEVPDGIVISAEEVEKARADYQKR